MAFLQLSRRYSKFDFKNKTLALSEGYSSPEGACLEEEGFVLSGDGEEEGEDAGLFLVGVTSIGALELVSVSF